jgi:UDPglucose 6-dehydrogenase
MEGAMKITVVGAGYVGLVTAACLAEMGHAVVCLESDRSRLALLQHGEIPLHEPGLQPLVTRNAGAGRLLFTDDERAAVTHGSVIFLAVGTPRASDGGADIGQVLTAARAVGHWMTDVKLVVDKSTVPVGTAAQVREAVHAAQAARGVQIPFHVASNPEFLKEGAAVNDFMHPDRVVLGVDDERAETLMRSLYAPFLRNRDRMVVMDIASAELTKYAANAMLATRISFMNELAALAERTGADIEQVRRGIGSDSRIGTHFLYAGVGWGGSCFPKDVSALLHMAAQQGVELPVVQAAATVNRRQRGLLVERVVRRFGDDLQGRCFGVWGLSFKPDTDDLRDAPSLDIISALVARGAVLQVYDPVAVCPGALRGSGAVRQVDQPLAAAAGADALLVLTEWREFRSPDWSALLAALREPVVLDGRNLYEPAAMIAMGFEYAGIGRPGLLMSAGDGVPVRPLPLRPGATAAVDVQPVG